MQPLLGSQVMDAIHWHLRERPHTIHLCFTHASLQYLHISTHYQQRIYILNSFLLGYCIARTVIGQIVVQQPRNTFFEFSNQTAI